MMHEVIVWNRFKAGVTGIVIGSGVSAWILSSFPGLSKDVVADIVTVAIAAAVTFEIALYQWRIGRANRN